MKKLAISIGTNIASYKQIVCFDNYDELSEKLSRIHFDIEPNVGSFYSELKLEECINLRNFLNTYIEELAAELIENAKSPDDKPSDKNNE